MNALPLWADLAIAALLVTGAVFALVGSWGLKATRNGSARVPSASARWVWNLTASAPACTAALIISLAMFRSPLWLMPISAMTKVGWPGPTARPAISTAWLIRCPLSGTT